MDGLRFLLKSIEYGSDITFDENRRWALYWRLYLSKVEVDK
jgi:hypothetical protein